MRALRKFYFAAGIPNSVVKRDKFLAQLNVVKLSDGDFNTDVFPPGTSGESRLYRVLIGEDELGPADIRPR